MSSDRRRDALEDAKEQLEVVEKDKIVVKAVRFLHEKESSIREEMQLFRDWYSLHFPELVNEIEEDAVLVDSILENAERSEIKSFSSLAENSKGADLEPEDISMIEDVAEGLRQDFVVRDSLENYISEICEEEFSNLSKLLGPILTARIIALSGSLEDLAKSPASTIQMLGAEKALFRHLGGGGKPPKHGILFEHQFVRKLPEDKRGKMARFLANKSAMAARLDLYGDKDKGEELREEVQEKYEDIK